MINIYRKSEIIHKYVFALYFQASFLNKKINVDGKAVRLSIWDTGKHKLVFINFSFSNLKSTKCSSFFNIWTRSWTRKVSNLVTDLNLRVYLTGCDSFSLWLIIENLLFQYKICNFSGRFHALGPIYYRSSNGAILVYDM